MQWINIERNLAMKLNKCLFSAQIGTFKETSFDNIQTLDYNTCFI